MGASRRQYTDEFKREAVGLLASSGRPLSQIAEELGFKHAPHCSSFPVKFLQTARLWRRT
jgi:hypothetical protein